MVQGCLCGLAVPAVDVGRGWDGSMASELDGLKRYLNLAGGLAGFAGIPVFDQRAIKVVNVDRVGVAFVTAAGWAGDDAGVGLLSPINMPVTPAYRQMSMRCGRSSRRRRWRRQWRRCRGPVREWFGSGG